MLDRPGCGLSDPLPTPPDDIEAYADNLIADLLDVLGLAEAHVVATSFGGYFALRGAAAHPDRIDKVLEFSWPFGAPMAKVPLAMRLGSLGGVGWLMARVPPTERAVRMLLRQIGLGAALESGRFDQASLDWYVALLRDTHTMRNEFEASPKLVSPIHGLNEKVLLPARLLADIGSPVYFLWGEDDPNGGADIARPVCRPASECRTRDDGRCGSRAVDRRSRSRRRCHQGLPRKEWLMQVWIDQDCCTGAGLCVDRCPDLFVVLEDGLGYVHEGNVVVADSGRARPVPTRQEEAAIDAAEHCPGECIYLEVDPLDSDPDDADIHDADVVDDPT